VPAGAVFKEQTFSLQETAVTVPKDLQQFSAAYRIMPIGFRFERSVFLTVSFDGDASLAGFYWSPTGTAGSFMRIDGSLDAERRTLAVELLQTGVGFVAARRCEVEGNCQVVLDPCEQIRCESPPATICASSSAQLTYASPGVCDAETAMCSYPTTQVTCNTPPASMCLDTQTLKTFASAGTCTPAPVVECRYAEQLTTCMSDRSCNSRKGICGPKQEALRNYQTCDSSLSVNATCSGGAAYVDCFNTDVAPPLRLVSYEYTLGTVAEPRTPEVFRLEVYAWSGSGNPGALLLSRSLSPLTDATVGMHVYTPPSTSPISIDATAFCIGLRANPSDSIGVTGGDLLTPGRSFTACGGTWMPLTPNLCYGATVSITNGKTSVTKR